MRQRRLRILVAPYFPENPYQRELEAALKRAGALVSNATLASDMLRLRNRFRFGRAQIVHLHWADKYCIDDSFWRAVVKTIRFVRDLDYMLAKGAKIVWTVHNLMNHERRHVLLERFIQRWLTRHTSAFIVHTEAAKQVVRKVFDPPQPAFVRVIPHGHYIRSYPNTITREQARAELGIPADRFVFAFFGRILAYKGLDLLLAAFARSRAAGEATLLVAGKPSDDRYGSRIRRACASTPNVVACLEHVPDERVQVFLNAADVVVLPYRRSLSSGAAVLATSFAKPIVAPRFAEIQECVADDGAIYYDDPDDVEGLRLALEQALRDRERLPAMGQANLVRAREFDWGRIANETIDVYRKLKKGPTLKPKVTQIPSAPVARAEP